MKMFFLIVSFFLTNDCLAQKNTQNIRGIVSDKLSQMPLIGASLQIFYLQKGTITDSLGKYTIPKIAPDSYEVKITYTGNKSITIPNVVVTSGNEVMLDIAMEETFNQLSKVVVKASNKGGTINKLASVSARTF